jgi:hypothetical protein
MLAAAGRPRRGGGRRREAFERVSNQLAGPLRAQVPHGRPLDEGDQSIPCDISVLLSHLAPENVAEHLSLAILQFPHEGGHGG